MSNTARGHIEQLPSGSFRVYTLAGKVEDLAQAVDALDSGGDRVPARNWVEPAAQLA